MMVRNYKKKTTRGEVSAETMKAAVHAVKAEKRSIRRAAEDFGIPFYSVSFFSYNTLLN